MVISICCSILLLADLLEVASAAITCICWAIIRSKSDFLMDLEDALVESVDVLDDAVPVSCCWFICDSRDWMRSSSCCSQREGVVMRELVGKLKAV